MGSEAVWSIAAELEQRPRSSGGGEGGRGRARRRRRDTFQGMVEHGAS